MASERFRLVTFDLDGTLFMGNLPLYLNEKLENSNKVKQLHERYHRGEITEAELNVLQVPMFGELNLSEAYNLMVNGPIMKNLEQGVEMLKKRKLHVDMLTLDPFQILFKQFGIDCDISATADYTGDRISSLHNVPENKISFLEDYCYRNKITLNQCIHVGDESNDIPTFKAVGLPVAVNPKNERVISSSSISVETDDFLEVASTIIGKVDSM